MEEGLYQNDSLRHLIQPLFFVCAYSSIPSSSACIVSAQLYWFM